MIVRFSEHIFDDARVKQLSPIGKLMLFQLASMRDPKTDRFPWAPAAMYRRFYRTHKMVTPEHVEDQLDRMTALGLVVWDERKMGTITPDLFQVVR